MVKVEDKKEGVITYYPFINDEKEITRYEPCIVRKSRNNKQVVDLNFMLSDVDRDKWNKINDIMKEIFVEVRNDTSGGVTITSGNLVWTGNGFTIKP